MSAGGAVSAPLLRVSGLHAGYAGRPVLRGVSFALDAGECAALLGPNGGGKTTLLRALSGVLAPQAGRVSLGGRPLARLPGRERARLVAVVPQRAVCPPRLTVRQMVLLGRYPHLSWLGVYGRRDYAAADRALEETGAAALARRPLAELSGGEAQRVLLARALAQEAPLLLLDEPAAGLDPARLADLLDVLDNRRRAGSAILLVLHDANAAALRATRLLGLAGGRLLFDGPVPTAFTEENLHALYQTPFVVLPHPRCGLPQALSGRTPLFRPAGPPAAGGAVPEPLPAGRPGGAAGR